MISDDDRVWTGGLALRIEPDGTQPDGHRAQLPECVRTGDRLVRRSLAERQRRPGDDLPDDVVDGRRERRLFQRRRHALLAGGSPSRSGHVHGPLAPGRPGRAAGGRQHRRRRAGRRRPLRKRRARKSVPGHAPERRCRPQRDLRLSRAAARRRLRARALRLPVEPGRARHQLHLEPGRSRSAQVVPAERRGRRPRRRHLRRRLVRPDRRRPSDAGRERVRPHLSHRTERPQAHDAGDRPEHDRGTDSRPVEPGSQRPGQRIRAPRRPPAPPRCRPSRNCSRTPIRSSARAQSGCSPRSVPKACARSNVSSPMAIRRFESPPSAHCAASSRRSSPRRAASPPTRRRRSAARWRWRCVAHRSTRAATS